MFFFFIGGLDQVAGKVLKAAAGRCLRCGGSADLVESEKVLKLFFIPVYKWRSEDRMFYCRDCSFLSPDAVPLRGEEGEEREAGAVSNFPRGEGGNCRACARSVDRSFRFCPYCGNPL
ncbi:hypothetical protein LUZ60_003543 [Juncus effusus]|nr:hypothetical protein LUZ60_003543 [Juncus effusus]